MTYGWGPGEGAEGAGQWWSDEGIDLLMGIGRYDKAKTAIYRVLEKDPSDVRALCVLMRCQYALDEPSLGTSAEITRVDPAHGCAWIHRSFLSEDLGHWAEAEENAREAIRLDPGRVDALIRLAAVLAAQPERSTEGLEVAREAARLDPEHLNALTTLAYAAQLAGSVKEAEKAVRAVLRLDPENGWALHRLAVIKVQRGHYSEARRLLKAAVATDPMDDELREAQESFERDMYGSTVARFTTGLADSTPAPYYTPEARKAARAQLLNSASTILQKLRRAVS